MLPCHPKSLPTRNAGDPMKLHRRFFVFFLALLLLLGLAYVYRAFFITYLIEPIARILWLVYRTFLTVNQEVYWGLLILTALVLILRLIPAKPEISYRLAYLRAVQEIDRVKVWENLLKSAEESESDRIALQHELEALNKSIGALVEGNDEKCILLPPFRSGFQRYIAYVRKSISLSRIFKHKRVHEATELEKSVDITLKSIETKLEINIYGTPKRTNPG